MNSRAFEVGGKWFALMKAHPQVPTARPSSPPASLPSLLPGPMLQTHAVRGDLPMLNIGRGLNKCAMKSLNPLLYSLAAASLALSFLLFLSFQEIPGESAFSQLGEPRIHWHASLQIVIDGREIPIPAGVGLTPSPKVQHTHDWDGIIHIETESEEPANFRLGTFFDIWGVSFSKGCLFQYCGLDLSMFVNGEESQEFDNYLLQDGDEVLIVLETS